MLAQAGSPFLLRLPDFVFLFPIPRRPSILRVPHDLKGRPPANGNRESRKGALPHPVSLFASACVY